MRAYYWTRPWMKGEIKGFDKHYSENIGSGLCSGCGLCVSACPSKAITMRRAEPDPELTGVCRAGAAPLASRCGALCPVGIDVPKHNRLIGQGKFNEALAVIKQAVPFPGILGRVCTAPCEELCHQGVQKEPIAIKMLKRFVYDNASYDEKPAGKATGKKVAIVGSGPAGLSAAYYLAKLGHGVTIFEALPQAGGMMRVGISEHRLPRKILDQEIGLVKKLGVEIKTNSKVDSLEWLFQQGFDAAFLAVGAHRDIKMGVEGEESPGVIDGVSFLRRVGLGDKVKLGDEVAVIGGGNVAMESARTALRLGAKKVTIIYRRTRTEMLAYPVEVERALEEGVKIIFLGTPSKISRDGRRLKLTCNRMELGEIDGSGRRRPIAIKGSEFSMEFDSVVAAIGQVPDIPTQFNLRTSREGTIQVNPDTLETSRLGIFAAGDAVTGPASVVEAMAAAKKAAIAIDKHLGGDGALPIVDIRIDVKGLPPELAMGERRRAEIPCLSLEQRLRGFDEVEIGLSEEMAKTEGERCWSCDQCALCSQACPTSYIPLTKLEEMVFGRTKTAEEAQLGIYRSLYAGNALHPDIRKAGVAGGVVTALFAYGLESGVLDCAIVAGWDETEPWKVAPKIATTRQELIEGSRSKYSVSQTLSVLREAVDRGFKKIGIVGPPCFIIGLRKMQLYSFKMMENVAIMIGLYCLSQTYIEGTEYMIRDRFGIPLEDVEKFAFRAEPYPGYMTAWSKTGEIGRCELMALWGMAPTIFMGFRLERCLVCQEHLSELADISCGDVWGRTDLQEEAIKEKVGHTEIFLRTEKGEKYFEAAVGAGYVKKMPGSPPDFPIEKHYVINPGWFKRVGSQVRIRQRAKYGWPLPKIE
jgi:NADPH-dependent glutamate synthase beta subunit-like oxidoreductase